jgi:protein-L-isoaspartate O-methyltransferase
MSPAVDFEARYREDPDPWGYTSSAYERDKYAATLQACGEGPFDRALELGGSIGVFSAQLAPHCRTLTTIDAAPTAVAQATRRLDRHPQATAVLGQIPAEIPDGLFDLVVASEILYYLQPPQLSATLNRLETGLAAAGRLVAVHWRPPGPERPLTAAEVHEELRRQTWLAPMRRHATPDYLLDVLVRA